MDSMLMDSELLKVLNAVDSYIEMKQYISAKKLVDITLPKDPSNPELWRRKAIIFEKMHMNDRVHIKTHYEQAIAVGDTKSIDLLKRVVKYDNDKKKIWFVFVIVIWIAFVVVLFLNGGNTVLDFALNPPVSTPTITPTNTKTPTAIPSSTLYPTNTVSPTITVELTQTSKNDVRIYIFTTGLLAIRSGPGVEYDLISTLSQSSKPKVIGRNIDNTWFKLKFENSYSGWIRSLNEHVLIIGDIKNLPILSK